MKRKYYIFCCLLLLASCSRAPRQLQFDNTKQLIAPIPSPAPTLTLASNGEPEPETEAEPEPLPELECELTTTPSRITFGPGPRVAPSDFVQLLAVEKTGQKFIPLSSTYRPPGQALIRTNLQGEPEMHSFVNMFVALPIAGIHVFEVTIASDLTGANAVTCSQFVSVNIASAPPAPSPLPPPPPTCTLTVSKQNPEAGETITLTINTQADVQVTEIHGTAVSLKNGVASLNIQAPGPVGVKPIGARVVRFGQSGDCAVQINVLPFPTLVDFAGMFSPGYNNPATGGQSCPAGYNQSQILGTAVHDLDRPLYVCTRPHAAGRDSLYDFAGLFGFGRRPDGGLHYPNPASGGQGCPGGYNQQVTYGTHNKDHIVAFCYRARVPGTRPLFNLSGMYGYYNNGAGHALYPNIYTGGGCHAGFAPYTALGQTNLDYHVVWCGIRNP